MWIRFTGLDGSEFVANTDHIAWFERNYPLDSGPERTELRFIHPHTPIVVRESYDWLAGLLASRTPPQDLAAAPANYVVESNR